jgi:chemotaxis protein CheZ
LQKTEVLRVQHKQFRIEKMLASGRDQPPAVVPAEDPVATFKRSLAALVADDDGRRLTRAAAELGAAIESMEKATQVVLAAAESIDDGVRTMSDDATGPGCERAPEMQRRIAQIYEACNFQDLAGQRIGKVIALLAHLEEQLAHVTGHVSHAAPAVDTQDGLINGPRLDGASGHVSQSDIDLLFG